MSQARRGIGWALVPVAVAVAALAGVFVWLQATEPDPGFACSPIGDVRAPTVTHPTGFYPAGFEVEVQAQAGSGPLYYTLDGSYPDPLRNPSATAIYDQPIQVTDRTGQPLTVSRVRTQIDPDALAEGGEGERTWDVAEPDIQRAMVIRARQLGAGECVAVFFVGDHLRRPDLPVVHLATDPDHLFGHDTGIYVPGRAFTDYLAGDQFDPDNLGWPFLPGNYRERGRQWERPTDDDLDRVVVMHWFEPGGQLAYSTNLGLRIHGGATRSLAQKSLRLYARNEYGNGIFDYAFFGVDAPATHRRLILRNAGNDCVCANPIPAAPRTHFVDAYLQGLVADLAFDTQAARPAVLFVDGEYWGIHHLRERYDRHYLAITHGVSPDDVVMLDQDLAVQEGQPEDADSFTGFLDFLAEADPADPATLAEVERTIDVANFIDYTIVETFVGNGDWPANNIDLWRTRTSDGSDQADGRWRWMLYDLDAVGNWGYTVDHDEISPLLDIPVERRTSAATSFVFDRLMRIDEVRLRFVARTNEMLDTTFDPARTLPELDRWETLLAAEMLEQRRRWFAGYDDEAWAAHRNASALRTFMAERPDAFRQQVVELLGAGVPVAGD